MEGMTEDRVAILVKKTALAIEKKANRMLSPYGLTDTQFKVLMCLYRNPRHALRQVDLEEMLAMRNPTITGIVQNLERGGFVRRTANPEDGRSKLVTLAGSTLALMEELTGVGEALEEHVTRTLSEAERAQAMELLKKMIDAAQSDENE